MKLLAPQALWLLTLAAPLVLLYFLKLRRRRVVVASLAVWRAVASDPRANSLFERLRRRSHLLLQLLLLLLLAWAATRPYLPVRGLPGTSLVVVVDRSGSMQAVDADGIRRFDKARTRLLELISGIGSGEQMMILGAGSTTDVATPFTDSRAALERAARGLTPTDAPADLAAAIATAQALAHQRSSSGVVVLSDLAAGRLANPPRQGNLRYEMFGDRADNLAVTVLAVRPRANSPVDLQALVAVRNRSDLPRTVGLVLHLDDALLRSDALTLEPGATDGRVIDLPTGARGLLTARIEADDALAIDDVARAVVASPRPLQVVVRGPLNPWLERALRINPAVAVVGDAADAAAADVLIAVGAVVPPSLTLPTLFLDPQPTGREQRGLFGVDPPGDHPILLDFRSDHPVMAHLELTSLQMAAASRLTPPAGAETLVESSLGPLLLAGTASGGRWLALGLDPLASDLPLRVAFPLLIQNALSWLHGAELEQAPVLVGTSRTVAVSPGAHELRLVPPGGGTARSLRAAGGRVVLSGLDTAGLWQLEGDGEPVPIAVNAGSDDAADLRPGRPPQVEPVADGSGATVLTGRDLVPLVLLAILSLLLLEWYAYHRRRLG